MMNSLKFCVIFVSIPPPNRVLCETIERLEHECMVAMAIPAGFLKAEPPQFDLSELVSVFEMLPASDATDLVLTKEVHHEVTQTPGTKRDNPQPRRTVGAWDCRWG